MSKAALIAAAAAFWPLWSAPAPYVLYVSSRGNDAYDGSAEKPFATIERAQKAVRALIAAGLRQPVRVVLFGGTYVLRRPLRFGVEDSGTERFSVTYEAYPGQEVVLSGGRRLTGWKKTREGTWGTYSPDLQSGSWHFRQLYVDGGRAVRARSPNAGGEPSYVKLRAVAEEPEGIISRVTVDPTFARGCAGEKYSEIVIHGNWAINRKLIDKVDPEKGVLFLKAPHVPAIRWNRPAAGRWCYLENARAFLDSPGEWYADTQAGRVFYLPDEGVDMARAEIIAPVLSQLLILEGTPRQPVKNLHFVGLCFMHTSWPLPPYGYHGIQACHYAHRGPRPPGRRWHMIDAAVLIRHAEGVSLRDGTFAHLGGSGLFLAAGCRLCRVSGNHIFDVGANGVMVGGPNDPERAPRGNSIDNNYIHHIGVEFFGAVAVWVGFAAETQVAHNLIHDTPYTGISVGWNWNPKPTACRANVIAYNHVYNTMKKLADGGCIYTLGFQPGTVLRGNLLHDAKRSPYAHGAPNNGIFVDEGSKGFLFERNVIYDTSAAPIRFNQCIPRWHTWRENVLGLPAEYPEGGRGTFAACGKEIFQVPHRRELDPPQFTLEAWVYLNEFPGAPDSRRWIVNKNGNEWTDGHFALFLQGSRAGAYLNVGGGKENCFTAWAPGRLKRRRWHHLACTYDGSTLVAYIDGKAGKALQVNRARRPGGGGLAVGGRQDGWRGSFFCGLIDEVRLYHRALSGTEIATRAKAGTPQAARPLPHAKGLVAAWSFEDRKAQPPDATQKRIVEQIRAAAGLKPAYRGRLLGKRTH